MRAATGSQCKLMNRGVTCVLFGSLKINLAAVFPSSCPLFHSVSESFISTSWQCAGLCLIFCTDVVFQGTFLVTQAVSKALVSAGAVKGSIITVGSIVGKVGNIGQVNYSASKAGVEGLTRTAAKELSKFGIRCNCVLPGFITTPMTDKVPEKVIDKVSKNIADACAFLASDDSRYITGISIEVAGGLFIG
uniref:Estradiol 17-beta-dehydrogenase 8-like n=1 Tax=Sinocyclocheilus rhinocerous TaxID=307959 RepID=A0A673LE39_9TELE